MEDRLTFGSAMALIRNLKAAAEHHVRTCEGPTCYVSVGFGFGLHGAAKQIGRQATRENSLTSGQLLELAQLLNRENWPL